MTPDSVNAAYGLRNEYRTPASMAFFPAEALLRLYDVLADVRTLMSALAVATQGLVVIAMLAGIMAILMLHRRQFAVLRALGAPRSTYSCASGRRSPSSRCVGALGGLVLGAGAAFVVSHLITRTTGIVLTPQIGADELLLVSGMIVFGLAVATVPAVLAYRRPVIAALTSP